MNIRITPFIAAAAVLMALGLQGCERGADSGATATRGAPGRPGDNPTITVSPMPTSIPESPQVGGTTANIPQGITGSGGPPDYPGEMQGRQVVPRQAGVGTDGGLEDRPASALIPGDSAAGVPRPSTTGS